MGTTLSAVTEIDHDLIVARTMQSLASAKAKGCPGVRRPEISTEQMSEIYNFFAQGKSLRPKQPIRHGDSLLKEFIAHFWPLWTQVLHVTGRCPLTVGCQL